MVQVPVMPVAMALYQLSFVKVVLEKSSSVVPVLFAMVSVERLAMAVYVGDEPGVAK